MSDAIEKITEVRRRNNDLWMKLLRIALENSPAETKVILSAISLNDSEITTLLKGLAYDN